MKLSKKVYVVGGYNTSFIGKLHPDFIWKKHPDFGVRENPSLEALLKEAVHGAFDETGIDPELIEKGFIGNFVGSCFVNQAHLGSMLAKVHESLAYKPLTRVEGACASGGLAVLCAIDSLQAGCDVVLATGVEVQTTVSARVGADFLARAAHYDTEREIDDFTFPCLFARRGKAYKEAFGATSVDFDHITVKAYTNGNKNPKAHMKNVSMNMEKAAPSERNGFFLANETYREHLKISDCSQVSDGASALVLATEEGLRRLGVSKEDSVEILSYGHATGPLGQVDDLTELGTSRRAAEVMYRDSGLTPQDIQVAEVHDCFSLTEVMMYEALGFASRGEGAQLASSGETGLEGRIPVNTGGGLIAFGHPVGATGIKQVFEIYRQLTDQCGEYQVNNNPKLGITANMGGDDRTSVMIALRKT